MVCALVNAQDSLRDAEGLAHLDLSGTGTAQEGDDLTQGLDEFVGSTEKEKRHQESMLSWRKEKSSLALDSSRDTDST